MTDTSAGFGTLLDDVGAAGTPGNSTLGTYLDAAGRKGVLPVMLIPALAAVTPLSGIPGVSIVCGIVIALLSIQLISGQNSIWLPDAIKRRPLDRGRVEKALEFLRKPLHWIDSISRPRLDFLFHRPFIWGLQVICLLSGLAMPFLEFIPFSSSFVAAGVALLAMSMIARDGLFAVLALVPYALIFAVVTRLIG